jgi:hypothetical protein
MWDSWSVGPGTSSILDLATTHEIHIIGFTPEQTEKILAANETYSAVELAGGVYRGIDKPVPTIGVWNVMICQASLDTDMVYKLAKALFENNDYLKKIHPSAAYTTPENAVKYSPIPLHPGTIKYLEEKGIAVPDQAAALSRNFDRRPVWSASNRVLGILLARRDVVSPHASSRRDRTDNHTGSRRCTVAGAAP